MSLTEFDGNTKRTLLKYVSKLKAHFVKMVNIFRNFYGIRDFTFAMHSYDNEDNFPLR